MFWFFHFLAFLFLQPALLLTVPLHLYYGHRAKRRY